MQALAHFIILSKYTLGEGDPPGMIGQEFIILVTAANLIAWPTAYFVMHRWIQNFAYRTKIEVWIFLLASILALLIAMATVCLLSVKAAAANPAQSLRYE